MFKIEQPKFVGSFLRTDQCPTDERPEYAFIGRSNVGKSSLINMLTGKKDLAKVSQTPGKTQMLNFFDMDGKWYIVDLPGYGYARISKKHREAWEKMIRHYLNNRENLCYVFVLIDSMIPPQAMDLDFLRKLGEQGIPFAIAYTKTDRLKPDDRKRNVRNFQVEFLKYFDALPPEFITSAEKAVGKAELLAFIGDTNKAFAEASQ
jgi:GTP-binding protein